MGMCMHARNTRSSFLIIQLVVCCLITGAGLGQTASAATITVDNPMDVVDANGGNCAAMGIADLPGADGLISLREAICAANTQADTDTILFTDLPGSPDTYTLSIAGTDENDNATGDLDITAALVISGNGRSETVIDANGIDRVFQIIDSQAADIEVTLENLKITGGVAPTNSLDDFGGGLAIANSGNPAFPVVILDRVEVSGNSSPDDGGGVSNNKGSLKVMNSVIRNNDSGDNGGGIASTNSQNFLSIENSLIDANTAADGGGGVYANSTTGTINIIATTLINNQATDDGGAGDIRTTGNIENTTISGNSAGDSAGGIYVSTDSTSTRLNFATLTANNSSDFGGGVFVNAGTLEFNNSIVADNTDTVAGVTSDDCGGVTTTLGHNLTKPGTGCITGGTGDITANDILLGPLANNSVSLPVSRSTHLPAANSPAVNAADNSGAPGIDGRGTPRINGSSPDIGAIERHLVEPPFDFGDAPDTHSTVIDSDGPSHFISNNVHLGATVDSEPDGAPGINSDDDLDDGVSGIPVFTSNAQMNINVHGGPSGGQLDGWIDYNVDGVFSHPAEHINAGSSVAVSAGSGNIVPISVPGAVTTGTLQARFRISTAGNLAPTGPADDGEVEDYTVPAVANVAPVANAGPDQTDVNSGDMVTLNGSATDINNGDVHSYSWMQTNGTPVTLSSMIVPAPSFTAPTMGFQQSETLTFRLVVSDATLSSVADSVDITIVGPKNTPPIANAGPDQPSVLSGTLVQLDGSASSSEDSGQALVAYTWVETSSEGIVLNNAASSMPTFTAPILPLGAADKVVTFSLVVNDGYDDSVVDTVDITIVGPKNTPPIADAGPDQPSVLSGTLVQLDGSASSSEDSGQALVAYTWMETSSEGIVLNNAAGSMPTFTAPILPLGAADKVVTFSLVVNDGIDDSVADSVTLTVKSRTTNQIPTANAGPDQTTVASGSFVNLDGTGSSSGDDGQQLVSYTWIANSAAGIVLTDPATATPSFTAPVLAPGSDDVVITFSLVVNDGLEDSFADVVVITVYAPPVADSFEIDDDSSTAKPIANRDSQTHTIHTIGGEDWMTFTLTELTSDVVIETHNTNKDFDTWLWLYDAGLNEVAFDDDGGNKGYSKIRLNELQPGTYFIRVTDADFDSVIAGYNISLTYKADTEGACAAIKSVTGNLVLLCF